MHQRESTHPGAVTAHGFLQRQGSAEKSATHREWLPLRPSPAFKAFTPGNRNLSRPPYRSRDPPPQQPPRGRGQRRDRAPAGRREARRRPPPPAFPLRPAPGTSAQPPRKPTGRGSGDTAGSSPPPQPLAAGITAAQPGSQLPPFPGRGPTFRRQAGDARETARALPLPGYPGAERRPGSHRRGGVQRSAQARQTSRKASEQTDRPTAGLTSLPRPPHAAPGTDPPPSPGGGRRRCCRRFPLPVPGAAPPSLPRRSHRPPPGRGFAPREAIALAPTGISRGLASPGRPLPRSFPVGTR